MKPKALLSFLKEKIKYNDQIIKEAEFKIKKAKSQPLLTLGYCAFIMFFSLLSISLFSIFFNTNVSILLSSLPMISLGIYQACNKNSFLNKLEDKFNNKFNTKSLFDISRASKVREEHLNQIKLSLTLDQYKALHIKYPNPSYEDVITFLDNIDDIDTAIINAEESKYMFVSTDGIKDLKEERVQDVVHL